MSRRPDRRELHPMAWWIWALGLGTAASRTTNPLLLALIVAVVGFVVASCRPPATWARGFRGYLILGLVVVGIRTVFHIVFGGGLGTTILITLPELRLPDWAAGIRLGGPVTAEGLTSAVYDGLRLATLLICVGAAVTLADPRRLLRTLPGALYELGLVVVVAVSLAPQLVEAALRVRRARALRGGSGRGLRAVRAIAMPVLGMALDRAVSLAAAMDSRGYGRAGHRSPALRRLTGALLVVGLLGLALGAYGLLDTSVPAAVANPSLIVGVTAAVAGLAAGSRGAVRSRYRAEHPDGRSLAVAGSGLAAAVTTAALATAEAFPSTYPVVPPPLPLLAVAGLLVALGPAWLAPTARTPAAGTTATGRRHPVRAGRP